MCECELSSPQTLDNFLDLPVRNRITSVTWFTPARLDKMMRQTASLTGRAWDGWRQEQLAWLFSPHQPSYYAKSD